MKEDDTGKKRRRISEQLKEKIKRKPYIEEIGAHQYTYSLLKKKNQKFILSNERLLILKGLISIGYAREIPEKTTLPFYEEQNLPPLKSEVPLTSIVNVTAQNQLLVLQFTAQSKQLPWQFACESKNVAEEWRKTIMDAVNAMKLNASNLPITVQLPNTQTNPPPTNGSLPNDQLGQQPQQQPNGQIQNSTNQPPISSSQSSLLGSGMSQLGKAEPVIHQTNSILTNGSGINNSNPQNSNSYNNSGYNNNYNSPINNLSSPYNSNTQPVSNQFQTFSPEQSLIQSGKQLPPIPQQHQDNETEKPNGRQSGHPLGLETPKKLDVRQEYMRKKKEEEKILSSLVEGESQKNIPPSSTLPNAVTAKPESKLLESNWDYEFMKGENEQIIVEKFKNYVEAVGVRIVDELALEQRRRHYKPLGNSLQSLNYQIGGITFQICLLELNEVSSFHDRSTIVSALTTKQAQQQFKNCNYILQLTRNRGRFRVPLVMLFDYKGFCILAKAAVHATADYSPSVSLQHDIAQLERDTRISRSLFEDEQNLKVVAADQKYYEKLSRSQSKFKKYEVVFLTDVKHYLPQDFYAVGRDGSHLFKLRPEFTQDEDYEEIMFHGGSLAGALSRVKVPTETRDAITLLTEVARSMPERAATLVMELENLDQTVTNSAELASLLHLSGLNIRYLGLVLEHAKESWLRAIISSQIVARSAKYFLRYDLQDSCLNLSASTVEQARDFQMGLALGWLNRVLGIGPESDSLWRQIVRQAQSSFKCSVGRQGLNMGFLLQALQHHGGFKLRGLTLQEPFFRANGLLTRSHFAEWTTRSRVYDLSFTELYSQIQAKMRDLSFESFEQLSAILNLSRREGLQSHYSLSDMQQQLVLFLINWLPPQQAPFLYLLPPDPLPSKLLYQVQLTAVKWELKAGRITQAERLRDEIVDHIGRWVGASHPILSELYDIFARYYLCFRDEEKRAVSYSRSGLLNQQKLLGAQHVKLADGYYALAGIYIHYAKKADALANYKRAAAILANHQNTDSEAYAEINLKVGQLYLANNAVTEALTAAKLSLKLAQELNNPNLFLLSAELTGRCLQVADYWQEYSKFTMQILSSLAPFRDNPSDLQRILKVLLLPALHIVATRSRSSCRQLLAVLNEFHEHTPQSAYAFLRARIDEKSFPISFLDQLDQVESVLQEIETSGLLSRWKGFENAPLRANQSRSRALEFLSTLQAVHWFLSGNFVEGVFAQQQ